MNASSVSPEEEALRESEQRFRKLLGAVTDYIYTVTVKDGQAVATTHGPGCEGVTGYTTEDYEKNPLLWYQMVYEEDRPAVLEQATMMLKGQPAPYLEHRIVHRDGSIRWVRNTPVLRYDADGNLTAYDALIYDITDRKKAEEDRERLINELKEASARIKTLHGLLPICASCKKIRDDQGYWNQIEAYISEHSEAQFTHGICPECVEKLYPEYCAEKKHQS